MYGSPIDDRTTTTRRVRRPKDKESLLARLVEEKVFETYRDALVFAAALGYSRSAKRSFDQTSEPIPWSVFSGAGHEALVNMLAVMLTEDFELLSHDRFGERLVTFEEYANGGLDILAEVLRRADRQSLDVVLDFIMDAEEVKEPREEIEIEKFASELAW